MDIEQVVEAIEGVLASRMEEVYGNIEALRQEVAEAVIGIRDTAQVLHDNDIAIMARFAETQGSVPAEFTRAAAGAWERFVRQEAEQLGWRVIVPKGGE